MAINQLDVLKHSLKTQNEQGKALIAVIERVESIERNVEDKYNEMAGMVTEVKNRVYIEYEDQKELQSIVAKKSQAIAKKKYGEGFEAEFRELVGYARRHIWKQLKDHFSVTRYTSIRHVDRDKAKEYVRGIELGQSFLMDYEQWRYQRAKKRERELDLLKNNERGDQK